MGKKVITTDDVIKAADNLKQYTTRWAELISKGMSDKEETINKTKVYNIYRGNVKDRRMMVKFINAANACANSLKKELESAL